MELGRGKETRDTRMNVTTTGTMELRNLGKPQEIEDVGIQN